MKILQKPYKSVYLVCISDRNTSGLVAAELSLLFSQEFHMRHIDKLYSSLYETRHLGFTPIDVINDTSKYSHIKIYFSLAKLIFFPFFNLTWSTAGTCSNKSHFQL